MGGLVIDIYVEFLYRFVVGLLKRRGSNNWPEEKAEVTSSDCPRAGYGCDVAENGELYTGIHEKGFIFHSSGRNYASEFPPGREITIRVKPGNPSVTIMREKIRPSSRSLALLCALATVAFAYLLINWRNISITLKIPR